MESSTLFEPLIIFSILIDGHWVEHTYKTRDPEWKDALKLACSIGSSVRFAYASGNKLKSNVNLPEIARGLN